MSAYGPVAPPYLCVTVSHKKVNCFKTSAATTHLDNEECNFHTHWRHFSFLSYTCKSIFSSNKQKESISMIEKPCILTLHTREHILHSSSPEPPLNHYSHEDAPPYGMTHIQIHCVRRIRHTPLREYHHHPTVTQHQHHLLIKESSGGGHVPNRPKKKSSPCTQTEDKSIKKQNTFSQPSSSMVVYFVPYSSHLTPWTKCAHIPHKKHLCRPTDYSSDFCKKWHTTSMRKMSPTQTTCWHLWLQNTNCPAYLLPLDLLNYFTFQCVCFFPFLFLVLWPTL